VRLVRRNAGRRRKLQSVANYSGGGTLVRPDDRRIPHRPHLPTLQQEISGSAIFGEAYTSEMILLVAVVLPRRFLIPLRSWFE
jgi:hypothetical protein